MDRKKDFELGHLYRLAAEILPFSIVKKSSFDGWMIDGKRVTLPHTWNYIDSPVRFTNTFSFPPVKPYESCYLRAWFGGESLVLVDGKAYGEANKHHKEVNLTPLCNGIEHNIEVQTVARRLSISSGESVFKYSNIVIYDDEIRRVFNFTKNVIEVAKETSDENLAKALIDATDEFLSSVYVPSSTNVFLKAVVENPTIFDQVMSTWSHPEFPTDEVVYDEELKSRLLKAYERYNQKIKTLNNLFPKIGKAFVAGHAHIDYAWLWPIDETKRKIARTFANTIQLAKKYREFIYMQSSAQMYEDVKRAHPEIFEEIKALVRDGRWEPVGGMWVESDCNVPSIESLIRQFYYGQMFFLREFGVKSSVAWLPDVFGFSWILPQVMKQSGIDFFATTKLSWNEANDFPYDICRWRGIDASEVVYYNFKNSEEGYNARISAKSLINTFNNFRQKDVTKDFFLSFGYGDGGGGPSEEMCENYAPLNEIPGVPRVEYSTAQKFFETLASKVDISKLPVWNDELYLELHRGTLTSQSRTKKLHRQVENELRMTEILNALFDENYQRRIDELWKVMLHNEFHDILPGSAIREVYEDAERELSYVIQECNEIQNEIVRTNSEENSDFITIFNPSSFTQNVCFDYEKSVEMYRGNEKIKQKGAYNGKYVYSADFCLTSLRFEALQICKNGTIDVNKTNDSTAQPIKKTYVMENEKLKVVVNTDGTVNIFNKEIGKWGFAGAGNILALYKDVPPYWENWDIDVRSKASENRLKASKIEVLEKNESKQVVRVLYTFESSTIEQFYILQSGSDELKIDTKMDWHHRRMMLKALFPTNVLSRYAKHDIDGGYIERPTHNNTNFEQARFEVLAHGWVDISQYDHGVCVINDGKYGHKVNDSTIEMTLLKAGIYPDFYADEGYHEFSYSIYVHGPCDVKEFYKHSERVNKGIKVFEGKVKEPPLKVEIANDSLRVLSLRKVDDKIYLRVLETFGSSGVAHIKVEMSGKDVEEVHLVDVLENKLKKFEIVDGYITLDFEPFRFYTLEICPK